MGIRRANILASLEMLRDYLAAARVNAVLARMDEHFVSEIDHLQTTVLHNIQEVNKWLTRE